MSIMRNPTDGETAIQRRQLHRGQRRNGPDGITLNLLASALTILTAIALLGAASVFADTSATVVAPERHERVIHDFYNAINEALRSGDATALDRIVAPDLVFHPPSPQIAPSRAGLERYLTGIHDHSPAFQIRVEDIVSDGDRAVARVTAGSETPGGFLGLSLTATPSTWGQFDSFRIADRQIVEIWSGAPAPVMFEPATEAPTGSRDGPTSRSPLSGFPPPPENIGSGGHFPALVCFSWRRERSRSTSVPRSRCHCCP